MNARESELVTKTSKILGKETKTMKLIDVIAELVEVAENQNKLMQLWLEEK